MVYAGEMGALQARLVFFAFIGISAVIAHNAIYLQDGPHPARFSANVENLTVDAGTVTASTAPRKPVKPVVQTSETTRSIQRELAARGYEPGPVDGIHGLLTRASIMAFQLDKGMTVTGEANEQLLKAIIFGTISGKPAPAEKPVIPEETTALIKVVQEILSKMGYDPGPVDGLIGPGTARAIRSFEEQQKMPQKGRISGKVLKALIEVTGADLASIQSP